MYLTRVVLSLEYSWRCANTIVNDAVKPVCNDHLYNKIYYLQFIQ